MRRRCNLIFILFIASVGSGCGVANSVTQDIQAGDPVEGITYFLPKKEIRFSTERKIVTDKKLKQQLEKIKKALEGAKKDATANKKEVKKLTNQLKKLNETKEASKEAKQKTKKDLDLANARKKLADDLVTKLEQDKAKIEFQISALPIQGCPKFQYDFKVELLAAEPDANYAFATKLDHSWFRDDHITIKTTEIGLLTSTNATASDRSSDILIEIAGAVAAFGLFPITPAAAIVAKDFEPPKKEPIECPIPKHMRSIKYQRILDPTDLRQWGIVNRDLAAMAFPFTANISGPPRAARSGPFDRNKKIDLDGLAYRRPLPYVISIKKFLSGFPAFAPNSKIGYLADAYARLVEAQEIIRKAADGNQVDDNMVAGAKGEMLAAKESLLEVSSMGNTVKSLDVSVKNLDAISRPSDVQNLLAPLRALNDQINVKFLSQAMFDLASQVPIQATLVLLPNKGPVSFVPVRSAAFVKTVNDVEFKDGSVTKWDTDHPSEVLEVVRLPVKILKALISVPTELIQLRVNYSNEQTNLIEAQKKQLEADQKLRLLQECIRKVEVGQAQAAECLSD